MMDTPRHNRVMGYVLQACNALHVELLEIYCSDIKCVYRFPGESENQAHWFLYGTAVDYPHVFEAIHTALKSVTFDDFGHVKDA